MSIFDRLAQLAKAELNDLADRMRERIDNGPASQDGPGPERDDAGGDAPRKTSRPWSEARKPGGRQEAPPMGRKPKAKRGAKTEEAPSGYRSARAGRYPAEIREAYAALELRLGADSDEIHAAYRTMVKRYHPDRHREDAKREDAAKQITQRVVEAHDRLMAWQKAKG